MKLGLFLGIALLLTDVAIVVRAEEPKPLVPAEQVRINESLARYKRDLEKATKEYQQSILVARKRLTDSYEEQIKALMRRGGGDALDLANQLNAEKKALVANVIAEADKDAVPASPTREAVMRHLLDTKWTMFWEADGPRVPQKFLPDGTLVHDNIAGGTKWRIERRWVLLDYLDPKEIRGYWILMDDNKSWRGFFAPNSRPLNLVESK